MKNILSVTLTVIALILVFSSSFAYADVKDGFYMLKINDEIFARIKGKSFKDNCTLPREDLRYLHVLHKDLEGNTLEGEMICNVYIAYDVLDILMKLYEAGYPIERMRLVDEYVNFRFITHTTRISKHGLGLAVDINTLYNPYVKITADGKTILEPATAGAYTDRTKDFPYKIDSDDLCYKLFTEHGFEWGGNWKTVKDYQHFEVPDNVVSILYPDNK